MSERVPPAARAHPLLAMLLACACTSEGTVGVSDLGDSGSGLADQQACGSSGDCDDPEEPYCDLTDGRCHECTRAAHCMAGMEVCAPWRECEATCTEDGQCDDDERCDESARVCLSCLVDAECGEGMRCDEGECEGP